MSQSYKNLIYHLIFSTKNRFPFLKDEHQSRIYDYLGGAVRNIGGISLAINGTEDHVHILLKLNPDKALTDILRDLKANTSGWIHKTFPDMKEFSWQRGYGLFTVSESSIERVREYISRQKQHHLKQTFSEELKTFLKVNGVEFDERYL